MTYNRVLEDILLPIGDRIAGTRFMQELSKWRELSLLGKDELKELERKNLRELIKHCRENIPFYRNLKLPETEDPYELIKHFPILTKKIVKDNVDELIYGDKSKLIKESSSGSSGIQGSVYMSKREESVNRAIQVLWWEWAGYRIGDGIIQTGMTTKRNLEKQIKDLFFRTDYYIAFGLDEDKIRKALERQITHPKKMLLGYASSLYLFAKIANESGMDNVRFESVVSWGDKMFAHYRKLIESQFNTKVYDTYACTEGFMIAAQCSEGSYHIMSPQTYLEILDDNGMPVKPGEQGRVIVTRLDSRVMPLVRYSLGDLAVMESDEKTCRCGKSLPLMNNIIGRDTDIVKTSSGKYLIVHFFTAIFEHIPEIKQFRVIQRNLDGIEIEYIASETFSPEILGKIESQIFGKLEEKIKIEFREVFQIPNSPSGKPQIIQSLLDKKDQHVISGAGNNIHLDEDEKTSSLFELTLKVKGFPIQEAARELENIRSLSKHSFRQWQEEKKWDIVRHHFEKNEFYRFMLGNDLPEKWTDLPVLNKHDYQIARQNLLSSSIKHKDLYTGYTSGSSGHPFRYAKDKFCHAMTWALIKDRYAMFDLNLDSKQARFYGIPFEKIDYVKERTKDFLSNRIRFPVFDLSDDVLESFLGKFTTTKFEYIYGYTNSIVLFARYLIKKNIVLKDYCRTLKICIGTSENCTEQDKKILMQAFGIPVVNEYGSSEVDLIAIEDMKGEWRISDENIFMEILDDDGNEVRGSGEGRIVLTSLHNKVMPFIRYEIGDRAVIDRRDGEIIIRNLLGGVNDIVMLPSGRKSPGITFYFITRSVLENVNSLKEFIIKQVEIDRFIFEIVSSIDIPEREKILLQKNMDMYLEPGLKFEIHRVDKIERTKSGKMKHFHSLLRTN